MIPFDLLGSQELKSVFGKQGSAVGDLVVKTDLVEEWNDAVAILRLKTSAVDNRKEVKEAFEGLWCHFGNRLLKLRKIVLEN